MTRKEIILPGKIAVKIDDTCFIYDNSNTATAKFKIMSDRNIQYSGFMWLNNSDRFIGTEYFKTDTTGIYKADVVALDLSGNIVDRVYESQDGEIAWYGYPSRTDKRLLFTTQKKGDLKVNPLEGLNRSLTIMVMDYKKREIAKIADLGTTVNFELNESPWLYDEDRFVYSIRGGRKITLGDKQINSDQMGKPGVYIYNLISNEGQLLIPDAHFAICSPINFQIGYVKDQSISLMDLKTNTTKVLYKLKSNDKVYNIHWASNGKFIYVYYFTRQMPEEKLIEVSTGKEVSLIKWVSDFIHTHGNNFLLLASSLYTKKI